MNLTEAMEYAKKHYPDCSFRVKEQKDGPTILSIKGKDGELRKVIYITKGDNAKKTV